MQFSRRALINKLLGAPLLASVSAAGTAIVMRLSDRKILYVENPRFAAGAVLPPASAIKPFSLLALLEEGKISSKDEFACSRRLEIQGHSLNCVHPQTPVPMNVARAIAYSCNGAVANFAQRFEVDELPQALLRYGFASQTGLLLQAEGAGRIRRNTIGVSAELQALGEEGITVTPLELLLAYARLSKRLSDPTYKLIRDGLEGAVEFGTAQAARLPGVQVAGKTGSIVLQSGGAAAWFAGFAPSREPRIAVVVLTGGYSGGLDAAPIAASLLKRYASAG